ncbi:hypothetical protein [Pediococcus acidilactici]|uniref:hypothetical protein n=1 Tax=Pediococcus acidilactici TaxID=1254 RepID=UPI003CE8D05B
MNADARVILQRIQRYFKKIPNTYYAINIVDDRFDDCYNFFFIVHKKNSRPHSIPLRRVTPYDLESLKEVVREVRKVYQLTIKYTGLSTLDLQRNKFDGCSLLSSVCWRTICIRVAVIIFKNYSIMN